MANVARMPVFKLRSMSAGEIDLARGMFGEGAAWADVRIVQIPKAGFGAMVPLGWTIVFSGWRAAADFADAPLHEQGWFVHELAHVWQAARGVVLPLAKLSALGAGAYRYGPKAGAVLGDYNIEQQAEIARHLFHSRIGIGVEGAPNREWLEDIWPL